MLFSCAISVLQESISSGFENFKASSLGSVGKIELRENGPPIWKAIRSGG